MPIYKGENKYIYGLHDRGGEDLLTVNAMAKGWVLVTEEIRANPNSIGVRDYSDLSSQGLGVIIRLNHAYGSDGTIPPPSQYDDFARTAANFVRASSGAHIWLIGNEMNMRREQPGGQLITPRLYADCYTKCRNAIKSVPGHQDDLVVTGAMAPWNPETPYDADPLGAYPENKLPNGPQQPPFNGFWGDYIQYLRDILLAIGVGNCDGIAIHAYSHGYDPHLVFDEAKMDPPFQNYYKHFLTYKDQMKVIPFEFRHLPVYLTEANGDVNPDGSKWPDVNSGWIKNAYRELDNWNKADNQQIRTMILYRWSKDDDWHIDGKFQVQEDLKEALAKNYIWDPNVQPKPPLEIPVHIENISAALPANPNLPPYNTRPESAISRFILHHSATPPQVTPQRIAEYQTSQASTLRPGIAYHFCFQDDGTIYQTQALTTVCNHSGPYSADSVGICLIGNFTRTPPPQKQLDATSLLLAHLSGNLSITPGANTIMGRSDVEPAISSPGATWPQWKNPLIERTQQYASGEIKPPEVKPGYRALYLNNNTPDSMQVEKTITVSLTLQNDGIFTWVRGGENPFHLGFKWFNAQGEQLQFPDELNFRTTLPYDVAPNQKVKLNASLRAPDAPGSYKLRWDMVHEQITWFGDQSDPGLEIEDIVVTLAEQPKPDEIQIQDISAALSVNPNLPPYGTRAVGAIRRFILHHSATSPQVTPQRIAEYQTLQAQNPRPGIAYHYCVSDAGTVYQTQPLTTISNHAGQFSADSVGICLIGNFASAAPPTAQLNASAALIAHVATQLNLPASDKTIFGYSDLAVTGSPGETWPQWKPILISKASALQGGITPQPPAGKIIYHYMLFWHHEAGNWADIDFVSAIDYIGAFAPTVGFSVEEAEHAQHVTIIGGPGGVPAEVDDTLRAAGCQVQRLAGKDEAETNQMMYELIASGKPFK
ncbi:MAG TPA: hypothetical protein G4N96_06485 [Chloroflexi bacterium]|nr:hypothetical protein [Chloroflexota bacterium]